MRVAVQADDLTGACDAGARFAARGLTAVVRLPEASDAPPPAADVLVLDTESRDLVPDEAGARARDGLVRLAASRPEWLFKKVDSTLRGPLAAEVAGALRGAGRALAFLAPAFPDQGRTVVDGRLLVAGQDAALTPVARDPAFPVTGSSVLALAGGDALRPAAAVTLETVRAGAPAVAARIRRALETGHRALVADAETDADLDTLVRAAEGRPVLLAGAAGLAGALAARLAHEAAPPPRPRVVRPFLVVAGSAHPVTREQVTRLRSHAAGPGPDDERLAARGLDILAAPPATGREDRAMRQAMAGQLGAAARARVETRAPADPVGTLILAGGDTAAAACRALGASAVRLAGELEPGLAVGALDDGPWAGLTLVTKAGGFGVPDTLVRVWMASAPALT